MGNYIATTYNKETFAFDQEVGTGQLVTDSGLGTQIINQLFSSNVTVGPYVAFWGNSYNSTPLGSGLVNLLRGVRNSNSSILAAARDYVKAAMQPFLNIGVITSFNVPLPYWNTGSGVACIMIPIVVTFPTNDTPQTLLYGLTPSTGAVVITQ